MGGGKESGRSTCLPPFLTILATGLEREVGRGEGVEEGRRGRDGGGRRQTDRKQHMKSDNKRQRNACSNYATRERTVLRTRSVTNKKQEAQLMLTNLRDAFGGQSMSPNIVPFHMLGIVSYSAIVTLSLKRAVFTIFDFKKCSDLEMGSRVTQGH